jgi:hypothetical protein
MLFWEPSDLVKFDGCESVFGDEMKDRSGGLNGIREFTCPTVFNIET